MDQGRGLEGVGGVLAAQVAARQPAQFLIDLGHEAGRCRGRIAGGDALSGDVNTVAGFCFVAGSMHAVFRWSAATGTVALGDLSGSITWSEASDASHDGKVIVGGSYVVNGQEPFRWTLAGGMVGLGNFPTAVPNGTATACSGDGNTVVGYSRNAAGDYEAFVWNAAQGMRSVRNALAAVGVIVPAGWKLNYAQDVSYDGTVVAGFGINPQGATQGFVARLKKTCPADLNGTGNVNTADLTQFLGLFGEAC